MALNFGTGERFRENDENSPGPGHYSPKHVEGYTVDPKSPFLGQERFVNRTQGEASPDQSVLGRSNQFRATGTLKNLKQAEKSKQYSWSTVRITELQQELQTVKAMSKAQIEKSNEDSRKHTADLVHLDGLVKKAEASELNLKVELNERNAQLRDQAAELEKQTKACVGLEASLAQSQSAMEVLKQEQAATGDLLHAEIAKLKAEVEEIQEREKALQSQLKQLCDASRSKSLDPPTSVHAAVCHITDLRQACKDLMRDAEAKTAELSSANEQLGALETEIQRLREEHLQAEGVWSKLKSELLEKQETLQASVDRLTEDLHDSQKSFKEQVQTLNAELSASEHRLKLEMNSQESLQNRLSSAAAERDAGHAKLELQNSAIEGLKKQIAGLEADFDQYKQGARAKYEQIQVSFDNEHLLCAKITADLTVSADECQRVKAKLAELETVHGQTLLEQEKLVTSLQGQLHILRGSHSEVNEDLIAKNTQVRLLLEEKDKLTEANGKAGSKVGELQSLLDSLRSSVEELSKRLMVAEEDIERESNISKKLSAELTQTREQAHSTESQLKAQLSSGEVMVDNLTAELGASNSHCESLKEDLATIRAQLVAAENEAKTSQQEVASLNLSVAKDRAELDTLSRSFAEKDAKLEATIRGLKDLEDHHNSTKESLIVLQSDFQQTARDLEASRQQSKSAESTIAELAEQLKKRGEALEGLTQDKAALAAQVSSHDESSLQSAAMQEQLQKRIADLTQHQDNLHRDLTTAREKETSALEVQSNLQKQLANLQEESQAKARREDLATLEMAKLHKEKDDLASQVKRLGVKIENLQHGNDDLSRSLSLATEESRSKDLESQDLKLKLDKSKDTENQLLSKVSALRENLEQQTAKSQQAEAVADEQHTELLNLNNVNSALETQAIQLKQEATAMGQQLYAKDETIQRQELDIQSLQEEVLRTTVVLREREQEIQEHLLNARQDSKDSVVSPTISIRSLNGRHSLDRTAGSEPDLQELQGQNLEMLEYIHALELRTADAEATVARKNAQVVDLQERLIDLEEAELAAQAAASEAMRLSDENTLLAAQMRQMEVNVKELVDTHGLGHSNGKQRIQYHLRLKEELEELRHECMVLLRERFQLEQCIRYMAATSSFRSTSREAEARVTGKKTSVQPASLRKIHTWATPSRRASLLQASRGMTARMNGTATPSKEELLSSIQDAVQRTSDCAQGIASDVRKRADSTLTPRRTTSNSGSQTSDAQDSSTSAPQYQERVSVEDTILARIAAICSPGKAGRTSALLRDKNQVPDPTGTSPSVSC